MYVTFFYPLGGIRGAKRVVMQHVPIHAAITMRLASARRRIPRENRLRSKRSKPHPPHTHEVRFIAGCSHFTHKQKKGFLLRLPPQKKPHAPAMRPLQCVLQQHVPIHAAITMRFASTPCKTPSENRLRPKRSNRTCRTHTHTKKVPFTFIAACSHFTRKNTRFRAPASSSPMQHSCSTLRQMYFVV